MNIFHRRRLRPIARDLYERIVFAAREPVFYQDYSVPDSLDGRFDMIVLHAVLVVRRIKHIEELIHRRDAQILSQAVFDLMFKDMDMSLREMGVGDLSVGKKVKKMAQAFLGRLHAYDRALAEQEDAALHEALTRNLYGTIESPAAGDVQGMAAYMRLVDNALAAVPSIDILAGRVVFPAVPAKGLA